MKTKNKYYQFKIRNHVQNEMPFKKDLMREYNFYKKHIPDEISIEEIYSDKAFYKVEVFCNCQTESIKFFQTYDAMATYCASYEHKNGYDYLATVDFFED